MKPLAILLFSCLPLFAALPPSEVSRMADAVYRIEGGAKTRHPYGVLSVKVSGPEEARKVCETSIRNNWRRWETAGRPVYFGDFMADRWCPQAADSVGNRNWKRNFRLIVGAINEK